MGRQAVDGEPTGDGRSRVAAGPQAPMWWAVGRRDELSYGAQAVVSRVAGSRSGPPAATGSTELFVGAED